MTTGKSCAKARLMNGSLGSSKERKEAKQWGVGGGATRSPFGLGQAERCLQQCITCC